MHIKMTSGVMIAGQLTRKGAVINVPRADARRLLARGKAVLVAHEEAAALPEQPDLADLTVAELRAEAVQRGLNVAPGARKAELIDALQAAGGDA